jgi:hypothetical protein
MHAKPDDHRRSRYATGALGGLSFIRRSLARQRTPVLVFTMHSTSHSQPRAEVGATGYVLSTPPRKY